MRPHCPRLCSVPGASFLPLWASSGPIPRADLTSGLIEQSDCVSHEYSPMPRCGPLISSARTSVRSFVGWFAIILSTALEIIILPWFTNEGMMCGRFCKQVGWVLSRRLYVRTWVLAGRGPQSHIHVCSPLIWKVPSVTVIRQLHGRQPPFLIQFSSVCQLVHCWTGIHDSVQPHVSYEEFNWSKQNLGGQFSLGDCCLSICLFLSFSLSLSGYWQYHHDLKPPESPAFI